MADKDLKLLDKSRQDFAKNDGGTSMVGLKAAIWGQRTLTTAVAHNGEGI